MIVVLQEAEKFWRCVAFIDCTIVTSGFVV